MENFRQVLYVNVYLAQEFLSLDLFTIQTDPKHGTYKFMIWMQYDVPLLFLNISALFDGVPPFAFRNVGTFSILILIFLLI